MLTLIRGGEMKSVKVTMKHNESVVKDFVRFHYRKTSLLFYILGVVLVGIGVLNIIWESFVSGITASIFGVFLLVYPFIMCGMAVNSNRMLVDAVEEMEFKDKEIIIATKLLNEEIVHKQVKYSGIERVVENMRYIYIYINKVAHIIDKNQINEQQYAEIITHISSVMEQKK